MKNIKSYAESLNEKTEYYNAWNAIEDGNLFALKDIIDNGFNPDTRNQHGYTILHIAAEEGQADIIEFLVGRGFDIHAETTDHETPLHLAAKYDKVKAVKRLIQLGARVNVGPITPLHVASEQGNWESIDALLRNHADANAKDWKGDTPLHALLQFGIIGTDPEDNISMIDLLVKKGNADINARNDNEETPLHYAINTGVITTKLCVEEIAHLFRLGATSPGVFNDVFGSARDIIDAYGDSIDEILPYIDDDGVKPMLQRMQRGKSAFGM